MCRKVAHDKTFNFRRLSMKIIAVENSEEKAAIVKEVLAALPEWFGLPESTQAYIDEARDLPLWAAFDDNAVLGFVTLKETSKSTTEIHCMGVKKAFHHQGIGKALQSALEETVRGEYDFLQVKTVDEGHYDEYDSTIRFYESVGFKRLEVFPTLWDEWNPCLVMVKFIG